MQHLYHAHVCKVREFNTCYEQLKIHPIFLTHCRLWVTWTSKMHSAVSEATNFYLQWNNSYLHSSHLSTVPIVMPHHWFEEVRHWNSQKVFRKVTPLVPYCSAWKSTRCVWSSIQGWQCCIYSRWWNSGWNLGGCNQWLEADSEGGEQTGPPAQQK